MRNFPLYLAVFFAFELAATDYNYREATNCYFCQDQEEAVEVSERLIYEGNFVRVIHDRSPSVPGHVLITPKRHVAKVEDLSEKEWLEIQTVQKKVLELFKKAYGKDDALIMLRNGKGAGQKVFHVHYHCYPSDNPDILEVLVPRPTRLDTAELIAESKRLAELI